MALMLYDFVAVCGAYFLALFLRFDCVYSAINARYIGPYNKFILPYAAGCIVVFLLAKMYNSVWRYASYTEFVRTLAGSLLTSVVHTVLITVLLHRMPISYYLMGALFQFVLLIAARFGFRFIRIFRLRRETASDLAGYDFVTQFVEVVMTNGTEYRFTGAGDNMTARLKLKSDAIRGENPENMDRYQTMLINPNSGEILTNPLLADTFDTNEGTVDVEFNAMGPFALI